MTLGGKFRLIRISNRLLSEVSGTGSCSSKCSSSHHAAETCINFMKMEGSKVSQSAQPSIPNASPQDDFQLLNVGDWMYLTEIPLISFLGGNLFEYACA